MTQAIDLRCSRNGSPELLSDDSSSIDVVLVANNHHNNMCRRCVDESLFVAGHRSMGANIKVAACASPMSVIVTRGSEQLIADVV